jgi:transcriptional regulator with XRE-family HTH domain
VTAVNLQEERLNRGLSLRAAAKKIGIGTDALNRAEQGTMPRPDSAKKIADFYDHKVTEVWPVQSGSKAAA